MALEVHEKKIQHRSAGEMPDSATYAMRETARLFGLSYSGFREAMLAGRLPEGVRPFKVGGQWRVPKVQVHRVLGIEE